MNIVYIISQIFAACAWIVLVVSYYRKTTNKILSFHVVSTTLDCIHYILLGGYAGALVCMFETIRDYGYYKTDKDDYIFLGSIPIYVIIAIFTCHSFIDLLPVLASVIDGYTLTKDKKVVVFGAIIGYTCWVIYAIAIKSYVGMIVDGILVLSNLSIFLFDKSLFEKVVKRKKK